MILAVQHVQVLNQVSSFKTKLTGNNTEVCRVNPLMFNFPTVETADVPLQISARPILGRALKYYAYRCTSRSWYQIYVIDLRYTNKPVS